MVAFGTRLSEVAVAERVVLTGFLLIQMFGKGRVLEFQNKYVGRCARDHSDDENERGARGHPSAFCI